MSAEPGEGATPRRYWPRRNWIGRAVALLLAAAILFAPGLPLDGPQRRAAATTALVATLWLSAAVPIALASVLPAVLLLLGGVLGPPELLAAYGHRLVLLFLGAFVVALAVERWGVHRRIALFIISTIGTSRRQLVLGFMVASAFLSMWINNTATTLLMIPIVGAVLTRFEEEDGGGADPRFGYCLLLGIAYAASVGGMGTPVGTAPNQVFLGQLEELYPRAPRIPFGEWLVSFAPLVVLFVPLAWLVLTRVVYRFPSPSASTAGKEAVRAERRALGPMSVAQKRMAGAFVATAVLWVFRADISLGFAVVPGWARLLPLVLGPDLAAAVAINDAHVALAMALFVLVCPAGRAGAEVAHLERPPRTLMDLRTAAGLPWDVLLLLGGGFCLAAGFQGTGLDDALGEGLAPLLVDRPRWVVIGLVALSVSFLTEITSNTATTAVLLPVLAAAAVAAGVDPRVVMLPATLAASAAFMMPVATPPNAVVFATRRIPMARMAQAGVLLNLMMVGLILLVFELWAAGRLGIESSVPEWAR